MYNKERVGRFKSYSVSNSLLSRLALVPSCANRTGHFLEYYFYFWARATRGLSDQFELVLSALKMSKIKCPFVNGEVLCSERFSRNAALRKHLTSEHKVLIQPEETKTFHSKAGK